MPSSAHILKLIDTNTSLFIAILPEDLPLWLEMFRAIILPNGVISVSPAPPDATEAPPSSQQQQPSFPSSSSAPSIAELARPAEQMDSRYLAAIPPPQKLIGNDPSVKLVELINDTLPCSVNQFFHSFFSDEDGGFGAQYHTKRGDTKFESATWSLEHPTYGRYRELRYVSPCNAPIGPKESVQIEEQYFVLKPDHLIVETRSRLPDIPLGDCFHIESTWEVTAVGSGQCKLVVSTGTCFGKLPFGAGIVKGKIQSGTLSESKESFLMWVGMAREKLDQVGTAQPTRSSAAPSSPGPRPAPTLIAVAAPAKVSFFDRHFSTDLLLGIAIGLGFSIVLLGMYILWNSYLMEESCTEPINLER